MENWKEKNVLVTGGGRGIGKRLSMGFAQLGARVGLLARTKPELDLTHLEIEHAGGTSIRLRADVRDFEQLVAAIDRMRQRFGPIHVLICAAGVQGPIGAFVDTSPQKWAETIDTNLLGMMYSCRAVLPLMMEQRSGKIIVISGNGAAQPRPHFCAYAASHAATARLVETLACEVSEHNIQINCMYPGGTYTSMTDEILSAGETAGDKEHEEAMQIRRTGGVSPDVQMQLAQFLASEASNHVTGKLLSVKDEWKKLQGAAPRQELYTLRRVQGSRREQGTGSE